MLAAEDYGPTKVPTDHLHLKDEILGKNFRKRQCSTVSPSNLQLCFSSISKLFFQTCLTCAAYVKSIVSHFTKRDRLVGI